MLDGLPIQGAVSSTYLVTENGEYTVRVTNVEDCSGTSNMIEVDDMVGIDFTLKNKGIDIYPNPASNIFYVKAPFSVELNLMSISGKVLMRQQLQAGTIQVDCSSFAKGMYWIKLLDRSGQFVGTGKISIISGR